MTKGTHVLSDRFFLLLKVFILVVLVGCGSDGYGPDESSAFDGGVPQLEIPSSECREINRCSPHVGFGAAPCTCEVKLPKGKGLCPAQDCRNPKCEKKSKALTYFESEEATYRNPVWGRTHMTIPQEKGAPENCKKVLKCQDIGELEVKLVYETPPVSVPRCALKYLVKSFSRQAGPETCVKYLRGCLNDVRGTKEALHVEVRSGHKSGPSGHFNFGTLAPPYLK